LGVEKGIVHDMEIVFADTDSWPMLIHGPLDAVDVAEYATQ
jgi:hypothetical protein